MSVKIQDKSEISKFSRFLIYKSVQVIVQSRLGNKINTPSKPSTAGPDWFNVSIKDVKNVLQETKALIGTLPTTSEQTICVELSLKTAEDDRMALEAWYIKLESASCNANTPQYMVYNRMGILLKSLFSITRITPTYRLSRKQGQDTYVICYRIYPGSVQINSLGSDLKHLKVGSVSTTQSTITLGVYYRTKLLISPTNSRELATLLKDDHFQSDAHNQQAMGVTPKPCTACNSPGLLRRYDESQCVTSFSTSPYEAVLHVGSRNASPTNTTAEQVNQPDEMDGKTTETRQQRDPDQIDASDIKKVSPTQYGAFAPSTTANMSKLDDVPFASLIDTPQTNQDAKSNHDTSQNELNNKPGKDNKSGEKVEAPTVVTSDEHDFVLIELKTLFAGSDGSSDIGQFYKDCQGAPALSHEAPGDVQDTLNDITQQLKFYESTVPDFDNFVDSLLNET